jgi:spectinomycin phosphotransferase
LLTEPRDLDRSGLRQVLERHWDLRDPQLEYLAVGFGSHHWSAVTSDGARGFVTVDDLEADFRTTPSPDLAFADLDRAFRTANALSDAASLEFVLAPLLDREGKVIRRLSDRYAVTVSPFIDGTSNEWGAYERPDDRRLMGALLGRLHASTDSVPSDLPGREDFAIPSRAVLLEALGDLDRSWDFGPFAEPTRQLLQSSGGELERRLHAYDKLVASIRESPDPWVVTHGEPHRANVMRDSQGAVRLIDWDTTLIAPKERDLWMVLDEELTGWDDYRDVSGVASLNHEALQLYRWWWELADIAIFVAGFRRGHERTEDNVKCWGHLQQALTT